MLDKSLKDRFCKGLRCQFAHSERELEEWSGGMLCRSSAGKLLGMCRNGEYCKYKIKGTCRYAHNEKELMMWQEGEKWCESTECRICDLILKHFHDIQ